MCTTRKFQHVFKNGFLVESVLRRKTKSSWPASLRLKRYRKSGEKRGGNKKKEKRAIYRLIETIKFRVKSRTILFLIGRSKKGFTSCRGDCILFVDILYSSRRGREEYKSTS